MEYIFLSLLREDSRRISVYGSFYVKQDDGRSQSCMIFPFPFLLQLVTVCILDCIYLYIQDVQGKQILFRDKEEDASFAVCTISHFSFQRFTSILSLSLSRFLSIPFMYVCIAHSDVLWVFEYGESNIKDIFCMQIMRTITHEYQLILYSVQEENRKVVTIEQAVQAKDEDCVQGTKKNILWAFHSLCIFSSSSSSSFSSSYSKSL